MMNQPSTSVHTNSRRPGGRTADVTRRVHEAIIELLIEGGVHACTVKAVAERARIERSTLYRRFPEKWDAIIDALMDRAASDVMPELGESFAHDLTSVLRKLRDILDSPLGPALLAVAVELRSADGGGYPRAYFDRRMAQLDAMFDATIVYPGREVTFWQFITGRVEKISVRARRLAIPAEFFSAEITEPGPARDGFKEWIDALWREKDELLA